MVTILVGILAYIAGEFGLVRKGYTSVMNHIGTNDKSKT
jgi:hypothetical protein